MDIIAILSTCLLVTTILTIGLTIWAYISFRYKSLRDSKPQIKPPAGTVLSHKLKATTKEIKESLQKEREVLINKYKEHQAKIRWK